MDMLSRNPFDPKHEEFHDGEFEFWPMDDSLNSRSVSIPAALANGLGLAAAAIAAAVLAGILSVLLALSSALAIYENEAYINVKVYNNFDQGDVYFTLAPEHSPDHLIHKGTLDGDESTLYLNSLYSGTGYILSYYSGTEGNYQQIGDFYFHTPGDPPEIPQEPEDSIPDSDPSEPEASTQATEETAEAAEETDETLETTEAPTESEEDEATEPASPPGGGGGGGNYVPDITPDEPSEDPEEPTTQPSDPAEDPEEPTTQPTESPEEPSEPESPVAFGTEIAEVSYTPNSESDGEIPGYYSFMQMHFFEQVSEAPESVTVIQDGEEIDTDAVFSSYYEETGELVVEFTGLLVPPGTSTTTTVTAVWPDGTSATSTMTLVTPSLDGGNLEVVDNGDGSYTIHLTVYANSDTDQSLALYVDLFVEETGAEKGYYVEDLPMTQSSQTEYTGSYTVYSLVTYANANIAAVWDMAGTPDSKNSQSLNINYFYN